MERLTDEQIWWRPNPASNSIGNLILHLNGNVGQWLVASFNGHRDERNRPVEFNERRLISRRELLDRLGATMQEASAVLARLTPDHLTRIYEIQGYNRHRPRRRLSGGRALRPALRANSLYCEDAHRL